MTDRLSLGELSYRLAQHQVTACSLVEMSLAAIEDPAGQGAVAFIEVFAEEARAEAAQIDLRRARNEALSPFAGAPFAVKDLFDVAGHPTGAGAAFSGPLASRDAWAVARLRDAGLIPVGHANMTEFAFSGLGLNPHHGTPLSPWRRDERRIAGGSTSGGAAAVADGMVSLALGSDTGGSCRIPAAFCNLVGFKPTQSRVPLAGAIPLSQTLDTVGWIANSVDCCIAIDRLLGDPAVQTPISLRDLRVGIPEELVMGDLAPEVSEAFAKVIARLQCHGSTIRSLAIPELDNIAVMNAKGGFTAYEGYAWHQDRLRCKGATYDPRVRIRLERGREQTPGDYAELVAARRSLIEAFNMRVAAVDVILFPTVPILPPRLSELERDEDYARFNLLVLRNSTVVNMVDGCAISIPVDREGPPIGLTIAAAGGRDGGVLAAAKAIEEMLRS